MQSRCVYLVCILDGLTHDKMYQGVPLLSGESLQTRLLFSLILRLHPAFCRKSRRAWYLFSQSMTYRIAPNFRGIIFHDFRDKPLVHEHYTVISKLMGVAFSTCCMPTDCGRNLPTFSQKKKKYCI